MDMDTLLLLIAFRHRIKEPNFAGGFSRFQEIIGRTIKEDDFRTALGRAVTTGYIYDPVRLETGTLQCLWCLEIAPVGAERIGALINERSAGVGALIEFFKA
jgi:hypothetical protein